MSVIDNVSGLRFMGMHSCFPDNCRIGDVIILERKEEYPDYITTHFDQYVYDGRQWILVREDILTPEHLTRDGQITQGKAVKMAKTAI